MSLAEIFTKIYREGFWQTPGVQCRSGTGSTMGETILARAGLATILERLQPVSFLDLPCGESDWLRPVLDGRALRYLGADIVPDVIERNQKLWPQYEWAVLDICRSALPKVDMVFCRDCFVHLSFADIWEALGNLRRSGSQYLVMTTFWKSRVDVNRDIVAGDYRRLDFTMPPFGLPEPVLLVSEYREGLAQVGDKCLGVWELGL